MKTFSNVCDCGMCSEIYYLVDKYGVCWSMCGECGWLYINI